LNKGNIVLGVIVVLLGGGLLWSAGSKGDSGIAGWETLNGNMEQAIGVSDLAEQTEDAGKSKDDQKVKDAVQVDQAVPTPANEKGAIVAGQNAAGSGTKSGGQTQTLTESNTPAGVEGQTPARDTTAVSAGALEVTAPVASQEGKINVNTAGAKELMDLPGIGEKKAQAIIDYRNHEGAFRSLSDLGKVKGIGPKMLEKLKPLVIF
jgi:competence protein ComEA